MDEIESLSHTKWECKYHVVFIPKCRRKTLYKELRQHLGEIFRQLATQKESRIEEGHLQADHVHMMISIPPKYAVVAGDWIYKREECNSPGAGVRGTETQFCWAALLGTRVLCVHGGPRREGDSRVHSESRKKKTSDWTS